MERYNVYCDESRHLFQDGQHFMVLGGLYLPTSRVRLLSEEIRAIKVRHNIAANFEIKWTKVSPGKIEFYEEIVDLYLRSDDLLFRAVVASKEGLDHERYHQTHDQWYYKIYYQLLRQIITRPNKYRVFIDIKDTYGYRKINTLQTIVHVTKRDIDHELVEVMQPIRSHESHILQVADLLIGAISHVNNGGGSSAAKARLIARIQDGTSSNLTATTPISRRKMNIFCWTPSWTSL